MRWQEVTRDRRDEKLSHGRSLHNGRLLRETSLFSGEEVVYVERGGSADVVFASWEFVNERGTCYRTELLLRIIWVGHEIRLHTHVSSQVGVHGRGGRTVIELV